MSPTIVLNQDDEVEIVIGSPGGANIIQYVTKSVVAMVDRRLSPQDAIDLGNFGATTGGCRSPPAGRLRPPTARRRRPSCAPGQSRELRVAQITQRPSRSTPCSRVASAWCSAAEFLRRMLVTSVLT